MKVSYNWLKNILDFDLLPSQVSEILTSIGLEVEQMEEYHPIKGGLKGVIIGEVTSTIQHPNADRLKVTKVNVNHGEPLSIVCGAPNVARGQKVFVATVGAVLYDSEGKEFEIKKSKIRGELSEGMICAEDEIGLGTQHDGIMVLNNSALVGSSASDYLHLKADTIFEIGITPNRADATSHYGVARDLAAYLNYNHASTKFILKPIEVANLPKPTNTLKMHIHNLNSNKAKRFAGVILSNVHIVPSPEWLQNLLLAIDVKPINNIVDITNYMLYGYGQPLHAYDYDKITGAELKLQNASKQSVFKGLNEKTYQLNSNDFVICDSQSNPLCLAGVMGGFESSISLSTKTIFLESAYFDCDTVRSSSKTHGLQTASSFRFERGTDPNMVIIALKQAAKLIIELTGASLSSDIIDDYPIPILPTEVTFNFKTCEKIIGKLIEKETIKKIITSLEINIKAENNEALKLLVPPYKPDVTREIDVIEEVLRIYGYNNVNQSDKILISANNSNKSQSPIFEKSISSLLISYGFNEMMGLSFTSNKYFNLEEDSVSVLNNMSSELSNMRTSLLNSGLEAVRYNFNHKMFNLKLYEFGKTYSVSKDGKYNENYQLNIIATGLKENENALNGTKTIDFYYIKSITENILKNLGIQYFNIQETKNQKFIYGLEFKVNQIIIAEIGLVQSQLLQTKNNNETVFCAQLNMVELMKLALNTKITYQEVSKFPSVRRDLALVLNENITFEHLKDLAFKTEKKILQKVDLFDIYVGAKVGSNKKSYALSYILNDNMETLTDDKIETVMQNILNVYKTKLEVELRA